MLEGRLDLGLGATDDERPHRRQAAIELLFLRAVYHDVQGGLYAIRAWADLLADTTGMDAQAIEQSARQISTSIEHMQRLCSDLLDGDRLSCGTMGVRRESVDVSALIQRVMATIDFGTRPVESDVEQVVVDVDPVLTERVVSILMVNAVNDSPPESPVHITARRTRAGLLLAVDDRGPGIPLEDRGMIFEAFRAGRRGGLGATTAMGLHLVEGFAQLHGGRAWVEDRPGGGASFKVLFRLPV